MDLERLAIGVVGAMVGVLGWLFVGLYIQRRDHAVRARSAARAVYFELELNAVNVDIARDHGQFAPLTRATFDRLLPEVATWLTPTELRLVVSAYQGQAGYDQTAQDGSLPDAVRKAVLVAISDAHHEALRTLEKRAFGQRVREDGARAKGSTPVPVSERPERGKRHG